MRCAGPDAAFAWPETSIGIIPGAGGTQRLQRLVGQARAKELIYTGRRVHAAEAVHLGLAFSLSMNKPALQDARDLAARIAAAAPLAVRAAKAAIQDGASADLQTALRIEEHCYSQVRLWPCTAFMHGQCMGLPAEIVAPPVCMCCGESLGAACFC